MHKKKNHKDKEKKQLERIEQKVDKDLKADKEELKRLAKLEKEVEKLEHKKPHKQQIRDFRLKQLKEKSEMAITGVQVGGSGQFQIGFVPPNGVPLQSGPTVSSDDPLVVLSAVDANDQFTAAADATATAASFNVTVAGVNGAGTALSHVFNVPLIAAPPPQITDFSLYQVA
jgi:hypothetical protein